MPCRFEDTLADATPPIHRHTGLSKIVVPTQPLNYGFKPMRRPARSALKQIQQSLIYGGERET